MYRVFICSVIILFYSYKSYCQFKTLDLGLSLGNQYTGQSVMVHITPTVGHYFEFPIYMYGGLDIGLYQLNPFDEDSEETYGFLPLAVVGGSRLNLGLFHIKKKKSKEKEVGVFLDPRIYFSPLLPRKVTYEEYDRNSGTISYHTVKGKFRSQLAYGLGLGIYFKPIDKYSYWALKLEYSTYDPFQEVRKLDFPKVETLPSSNRTILSLSLFF